MAQILATSVWLSISTNLTPHGGEIKLHLSYVRWTEFDSLLPPFHWRTKAYFQPKAGHS